MKGRRLTPQEKKLMQVVLSGTAWNPSHPVAQRAGEEMQEEALLWDAGASRASWFKGLARYLGEGSFAAIAGP